MKILRDTPQSLGLPSVELWKNETTEEKAKEENKDISGSWKNIGKH